MKYKFYGTNDIPKSKRATAHYSLFESDNVEEVKKYLCTHAVVPCELKTDGLKGWYKGRIKAAKEGKGDYPAKIKDFSKSYKHSDFLGEIYNWIRLDVDEKGEEAHVDKRVTNIMHIKRPSTSHISEGKTWKWQYFFPVRNIAQTRDAYALQYYNFIAEFKIDIKDVKLFANVIQNSNPCGVKGIEKTVVNEGKVWKAPDIKLEAKPKNAGESSATDEVVKHFNDHHNAFELLIELGRYEIKGSRLIRPDSSTNAASVQMFEDGSVFSHSGKDWISNEGDSKSKDAFDIWCHYNYDDDKSAGYGDYHDKVFIGTLFKEEKGSVQPATKKEKKKKAKEKKKRKKEYNPNMITGVMTKKLIAGRKAQVVLYPNIVVQGIHTYLFGAAGTNKTTLLAWIAIDILKRHKQHVVHFWSFDADQSHEKAIYDYAGKQGVNSDRFLMVVEGGAATYKEHYEKAIEVGADLSNTIIIIDTFKHISGDVNNKNENKKAFIFIKQLQHLGATVISLGHTNKDGEKQSGTAEIEQDSEALLRIDRQPSGKKAIMSISKAGRVRFNFDSRGISFSSKAKGNLDSVKYHTDVLNSIKRLERPVNLASTAEESISDQRRESKRKDKFEDQKTRDWQNIKIIKQYLEELDDPYTQNIKDVMFDECGINRKVTQRVLQAYNADEWLKHSVEGENKNIYKLMKKEK